MVANTQLNLLQKFGRFVLIGLLVFILLFWGASSILISAGDAHRDFAVGRILIKSCIHQPFTTWLSNLEAVYIPFFLRQRPFLDCYLLAATLAWLVAFFYDGRILRKENTL
jgi:uncharacterized protein involved in cysteine biosynthesis